MIRKPTASNICRAARVLRRGGLVAFPTETVYGLGADALNAKAVCKIFETKKRPHFDPLIVHVASPEEAARLWKKTTPEADRLIRVFWPGPLTIVLPKSDLVPDIVTAGLPTVAVRMPSHPAALALIRALKKPIAAPSANPFGRTSPTTPKNVEEDLGKKVNFILDGGPCRVGVESTVVAFEKGKAVILRPGGVPVEAIRKCVRVSSRAAKRRGSPGLLKTHYAPRTAMVLVDASEKPAVPRGLRVRRLRHPKDLRAAATRLFQAIRKLDKIKPDLILADRVPARGIGSAIMDRLNRASSGLKGKKIAERILRHAARRKNVKK